MMVALATPLLEGVAVRVLAALGVGIVGGTAGEAARELGRKRQEAADKAKAAPIARADATTKKREKCKECPPDKGARVPVNYSMSQRSIDYQAKITSFPPGTEWKFEGKDFDGFKSDACLLQEAKADYDQFFDADGDFQYPFQELIFRKMGLQAEAQAKIVRRNPPAALTYYFQTPVACNYMKPKLVSLGIAVLHVA